MKFWLHEPCSDNFEDFIFQIAQAQFIEQRIIEILGKIIHGNKG